MTHNTDKTYSSAVYKALNDFFNAYLVERNVQKTLGFISQDIYGVGMSDGNTVKNKQDFADTITKETEILSAPMNFEIKNYFEKQIGADIYNCCCEVAVELNFMLCETVRYKINLTASLKKQSEKIIITTLHMSQPDKIQDENEFFPLRFSNEKFLDLKRKSKTDMFDIIFDIMPGGIIGAYLEDGFPVYVINDALLKMLGYTYEDFMRINEGKFINMIYPKDRDYVRCNIGKTFSEKGQHGLEYRVVKSDGSYIWVFDIGRKIVTETGREIVISVVVDASETVNTRKMLKQESITDSLTGVLNRNGGQKAIEKYIQNNTPFIYFMIDLDNFKQINDIYGHYNGDLVLKFVGELFLKSFRKSDIVYRIGGDEFGIFIPEKANREVILKKVDNIINLYREKIQKDYPLSNSTISFGGVYGEKIESFDSLYKVTDTILYQVKKTNKGTRQLKEVLSV